MTHPTALPRAPLCRRVRGGAGWGGTRGLRKDLSQTAQAIVDEFMERAA